ncbi:hypothetical protein [Stratiformator vulcanicus]|uniref:YHS domain protein n=1 Tax=Stratiformator vulcanicus TaxID=2527980 RepID=A0A517R3K5_9PLAN|nr:hypothetical protein [Stratiformator vulcanicus]QDT38437.1 hypothetical protein Pan189_28310 [Stratiformator vulcanicus]
MGHARLFQSVMSRRCAAGVLIAGIVSPGLAPAGEPVRAEAQLTLQEAIQRELSAVGGTRDRGERIRPAAFVPPAAPAPASRVDAKTTFSPPPAPAPAMGEPLTFAPIPKAPKSKVVASAASAEKTVAPSKKVEQRKVEETKSQSNKGVLSRLRAMIARSNRRSGSPVAPPTPPAVKSLSAKARRAQPAFSIEPKSPLVESKPEFAVVPPAPAPQLPARPEQVRPNSPLAEAYAKSTQGAAKANGADANVRRTSSATPFRSAGESTDRDAVIAANTYSSAYADKSKSKSPQAEAKSKPEVAEASDRPETSNKPRRSGLIAALKRRFSRDNGDGEADKNQPPKPPVVRSLQGGSPTMVAERKPASARPDVSKSVKSQNDVPSLDLPAIAQVPPAPTAESNDDAVMFEPLEVAVIGPKTPAAKSDEAAEANPFELLENSTVATAEPKETSAFAPVEPEAATVEANLIVETPTEIPSFESDGLTPERRIETTGELATVTSTQEMSPQQKVQVSAPQELSPEQKVAKETPEERRRRAMLAKLEQRSDLGGFQGFCPVTLRDSRDLTDADPTYVSIFESRTYEFSSAEAKAKFDADPSRYAPVNGGHDVVLTAAGEIETEGTLRNAVWFKDRLYLFRSTSSLGEFNSDPTKFQMPY